MLDGLERTSARLAATDQHASAGRGRVASGMGRDPARGGNAAALPSRETITTMWSDLEIRVVRQERSIFRNLVDDGDVGGAIDS